jgi:ribosomal-protein-serine acetyltransferase
VEITLSSEDERPWVEGQLAARESGASTPPLIMHRDVLVGTITAMHLDSLDRAGEIGYWLAEEAQGKGIVTRACRSLLDHVFNDLDMHRIQIRAATDNTRSRAVPERLGFTYEGVQRQAEHVGGRFRDLAVYSMLTHEWKGKGH